MFQNYSGLSHAKLKKTTFGEVVLKTLIFFLPDDAENYLADCTVNVIHQTLIVRAVALASQALNVPRDNLSLKNTTKFLP